MQWTKESKNEGLDTKIMIDSANFEWLDKVEKAIIYTVCKIFHRLEEKYVLKTEQSLKYRGFKLYCCHFFWHWCCCYLQCEILTAMCRRWKVLQGLQLLQEAALWKTQRLGCVSQLKPYCKNLVWASAACLLIQNITTDDKSIERNSPGLRPPYSSITKKCNLLFVTIEIQTLQEIANLPAQSITNIRRVSTDFNI